MKFVSLAASVALVLAAPIVPAAADMHAIFQVIHHAPRHLQSALAELPDLNDSPAEEVELPELLQHFFQPQALRSWSYPSVERVQHLPCTSAEDIMGAVQEYRVSSGDDVDEECKKVVYETGQHLINGTIDFIEKKCSNESLPEKAKAICKFLTSHEEGVAGFITGFAQPYVLGYFYAAGNGSCPLHPFPINSTTIDGGIDIGGDYSPYSWLSQLVQENEFDVMSDMYALDNDATDDIALPHTSRTSAEWSTFFHQLLAVDQQEMLSKHMGSAIDNGGDDDDEKCKKCYMKVVSKYIKVVRKLRAKFCAKTKSEYLKNVVCPYLEQHQEFEVGLILGLLRPFKFAAGYCMGTKACVPHKMTEMAIEGSVRAVEMMF